MMIKLMRLKRNFQILIEALIDVSEYLISVMRWRTPKSYRDVIKILHENSIIDIEIAKKIDECIVLRNVLVHNYIYINPQELYMNVKNCLDVIAKTMIILLNYLASRGIDP